MRLCLSAHSPPTAYLLHQEEVLNSGSRYLFDLILSSSLQCAPHSSHMDFMLIFNSSSELCRVFPLHDPSTWNTSLLDIHRACCLNSFVSLPKSPWDFTIHLYHILSPLSVLIFLHSTYYHHRLFIFHSHSEYKLHWVRDSVCCIYRWVSSIWNSGWHMEGTLSMNKLFLPFSLRII